MSTLTVNPDHSRGQYLQSAKALVVKSTELGPLASDEVRIAIQSTTVCGSDVHYYTHMCNGSIQVREPLCLGHEAAGRIIGLGSDVLQVNPHFKIGDTVALECGVPCGQCAYCQNGKYNICPDLRFRSSGSKFPHYQGTLQEFVDHPVRWVHRLPPELNIEIGALLEPLAVAIHAVRRAGPDIISPRQACLVFGAGAVGLLCALAARAEGCRDVVMVDIDQGRLDFALAGGFASVIHAVNPRRGTTLEENLQAARMTVAEIGELKWPDGERVGRVQRTFECTGAESCLQSSIFATAHGGNVVLVGMGTPNHTLPISDLTAREINLVSTWRYADDYPQAIEVARASVTGNAVKGNALPDISQMITHRFQGLDNVSKALEMAGKTRDSAGQLVVKTLVKL